MVCAFCEELRGELEADAAVCWDGVSMKYIGWRKGRDGPPVTRTIVFATEAMMRVGFAD